MTNYQYIATPHCIGNHYLNYDGLFKPDIGEFYNVLRVYEFIGSKKIKIESVKSITNTHLVDSAMLHGGSWKLIKVAKIHREVKGRYER